jgi:hypothetical protein
MNFLKYPIIIIGGYLLGKKLYSMQTANIEEKQPTNTQVNPSTDTQVKSPRKYFQDPYAIYRTKPLKITNVGPCVGYVINPNGKYEVGQTYEIPNGATLGMTFDVSNRGWKGNLQERMGICNGFAVMTDDTHIYILDPNDSEKKYVEVEAYDCSNFDQIEWSRKIKVIKEITADEINKRRRKVGGIMQLVASTPQFVELKSYANGMIENKVENELP